LANFVIRVGISSDTSQSEYSVFQSAEVQKLWVLGKRQEAKGKGEEKQVYLTSLGNAIVTKSTHLVDFCLTIEMANSPQICLNRG
jgi:hypothetical protein